MKIRLLLIFCIALAAMPAWSARPGDERTVKPVQFAQGKTSTEIQSSIKGYHFIDYQVKAGAGQKITISLKASNGANYFNLLPPDSQDVAMAQGELLANHFSGMLPDEGVYTIRVYLMRSAARRNETSRFTLSVEVTGKPLPAVSSKIDAVLPGTRFHAKTTVKCAPQYSQSKMCDAVVIRRGHDGTATVVVSWGTLEKRRILFVRDKPVVADVPQPFTSTKDKMDHHVLVFEGGERFEIPDALVTGG